MLYVVLLVLISGVLIEDKIVLAYEVKLDCPPGYSIDAITGYKIFPENRQING